jgi:hypothetical protein
MLVTVAPLIAPTTLHRIGGEGTGAIIELTGRCTAAALLPISLALALDLAIALTIAFGTGTAGGVAGGIFAALALGGWFGVGYIVKWYGGTAAEREAKLDKNKREASPLHALIEQMLTEARVILPGAQALLGFQLIIVLTEAFEKLPMPLKFLHGAALLCVVLSAILLITQLRCIGLFGPVRTAMCSCTPAK